MNAEDFFIARSKFFALKTLLKETKELSVFEIFYATCKQSFKPYLDVAEKNFVPQKSANKKQNPKKNAILGQVNWLIAFSRSLVLDQILVAARKRQGHFTPAHHNSKLQITKQILLYKIPPF